MAMLVHLFSIFKVLSKWPDSNKLLNTLDRYNLQKVSHLNQQKATLDDEEKFFNDEFNS